MYDFNGWKKQRWERQNRYYLASLQQNLFGEWELVQAWGSKISCHGNTRIVAAENRAEAEKLFQSTAKRRTSRGYEVVSFDNP